jgi:hypothetical protein
VEGHSGEGQPAKSLAPQAHTAVGDVYVEDDGTLGLRFHDQARAVGEPGAEVVRAYPTRLFSDEAAARHWLNEETSR